MKYAANSNVKFPAVCKAIKAEFLGEKRFAPGESTDVTATIGHTHSEVFPPVTRDRNHEWSYFFLPHRLMLTKW